VDCRHAFIPERHQRPDASPYGQEIREKATILYVEPGASYRSIVRELARYGVHGLDAKKVWTWVQELAHECADPLEISQRLKPCWSGWLQVDGDRLPGLNDRSFLAPFDVGTRDIPCGFVGRETYANYLRLFEQLKSLNYPLKGLTTDGDPVIVQAARAVYKERFLFARCRVHLGRNVEDALRPYYTKFTKMSEEYERFIKAYKMFTCAPNWKEAKTWLRVLLFYPTFSKQQFQVARDMVLRALPQIVPSFFQENLSSSTNLVENFFRFIDRRINAMDRFQGDDTAQAMLKLLVLWYRFHKFTNPSKPYWYIKGKSPMELAGVKVGKRKWLTVGLKK
jgi:transposase-like protein